ncbi:MAG: putative hemolysin [Planctomycetota bacterium]|jgi:putative hemolysin
MSLTLILLVVLALLFFSAVFSGSETGFYCISPLRVEMEAQEGRSRSRLIRWLTRDDYALLITILIGNNLMLESLTHVVGDAVRERMWVSSAWLEVTVTLILAPIVFFAGELVPKELFRHRPHLLVGVVSPLIATARIVFYPLALPLRALSALLVRMLRIESADLSLALGREAVVDLLAEGAKLGRLEPHAERLALNVLSLRNLSLESEMVPWSTVDTLDLDGSQEDQRYRSCHSRFSRMPAMRGGVVMGYVHQLDVLGAEPDEPVEAALRPLPVFEPNLPVDRALKNLRTSGQRAALVGTDEAPLGLVTLKDLVETISGELAGW